jgi:alpha-amylase
MFTAYLLQKMKGIHFPVLILMMFVMTMMTAVSCKQAGAEEEKVNVRGRVTPPEWSYAANIYEVNIRQYTPEGTFEAFRQHLPRLKAMGVDILWLMPIHPISVPERKGSLGSYYAVSDFRAVNPNFGNHEDFKRLVDSTHAMGMHIILDWVPHHTGWDHPWIKDHPDYYNKNEKGEIRDPINEETGEPWGWTDVAELNLDNPDMRRHIIDDMIYWIEDYNVDGYRVDHAHGVHAEYWDEVSNTLAALQRPIFMLAEGEESYLRNDSSFVATYAWKIHHKMNDIANGKDNVNALDSLLADEREHYAYGYHIYFTSNHDENSWAGTEFERMGDGHKAFAALCATLDGMPLMYSGQEEPLKKRLAFFEKDTIPFKNYEYGPFYTELNALKKRNQALWNGERGGLSRRINTSDHVYAFIREKNGDKFIGIFNLSSKPQTTTLQVPITEMNILFTENELTLDTGQEINLGPWEFFLFSSK